jgi:hypothetical protein
MDFAQERQNIGPGLTAKYAILVLEGYDIDMAKI